MDAALLVRPVVAPLPGAGMTPIQIAQFHAHALTRAFQRKLGALRETVEALDPASSYVSFSAGKDSAVIAHACHLAHPGIAILMVDPGCPTHWTESERVIWRAYAQVHGWDLHLFLWDKWGLDLETDSTIDYQQRIHGDMFEGLHAYAGAHGLTCRVMGLRASESRNRRMLIGCRGSAYDYKGGGSAVLPIATWQTEDVWAYIVSHDLPWLSIYDAMGPHARNGFVGRSGEEMGRMDYLHHHFPDIWRWAKQRGLA